MHNECLEKTKGKTAKTVRATDREREKQREQDKTATCDTSPEPYPSVIFHDVTEQST